jgi:hypothetical protein
MHPYPKLPKLNSSEWTKLSSAWDATGDPTPPLSTSGLRQSERRHSSSSGGCSFAAEESSDMGRDPPQDPTEHGSGQRSSQNQTVYVQYNDIWFIMKLNGICAWEETLPRNPPSEDLVSRTNLLKRRQRTSNITMSDSL